MQKKTCRRCGETKPHSDFHSDKRLRDGRQSHCRACQAKHKRGYYRRHADRLRQERREYAAKNKPTDEQKAAKREYDRRYRADNAERLREARRAWVEANKTKVRYIKQSYKHRRRLQEGRGISWSELRDWEEAQRKQCYWCGAKCDEKHHVDHYIPLSKGGEHVESNLVIACAPCNLRKNAKLPEDFLAEQGRLA